jgi:hypothetical protein
MNPSASPRKWKPWKIGLLAVGGVVLAMFLGLFLFAGGVDFLRASHHLMVNGATAPGVRELSASLCRHAFVTDLDELYRLSRKVDPDRDPRRNPTVRLNVACFVDAESDAPRCNDVAKTYLRTVGTAAGRFNAVVRIGETRDGSSLGCSALFEPTGESVGDVPEILD